jgi:hypothetical protein
MNDHWNVLYQVSGFYADRKYKSFISWRKDLADFNLGFSKIPIGGFSISIFCLVSIVQVVS